MLISLLVGLIIIVGFVVFKNSNSNIDPSTKPQRTHKPKKNNPFLDLRKTAFSMSPEQLGLHVPNEKRKVYGIIADLDMGGATATIASFLTGDASIYLSTGGGFIGAGKHENVKNAVFQLIELGNSIEGKPFDNTDLPSYGNANFYLLSNKGHTLVIESIKDMENGTSKYTKLFIELNKVMSEIRIKTEQ